MVVKVTLNLPSNLVDQIKEAAKQQNTSVTDLFRRGLQTDLFLSKEEDSGAKVLLKRKNGQMVELYRPK